MAKIPHRPEPTVTFDYSVVRKHDSRINNKAEAAALFKNAIRLADERMQHRAMTASVRGGEKFATERTVQIDKGSGRLVEQAADSRASTMHAENRSVSQHKADTNATQTNDADAIAEVPSELLEQVMQDAELNVKKRSHASADNDGQQVADAQSAQAASQAIPDQQLSPVGMFMPDTPKSTSQDMGQFESIQSACKFLEKMNSDTSSKAWRFSLPGDEFVSGVHMEQGKNGGWSITVASDEEHTDALNEHLDTLISALEDSGMQVTNVALS